MTDSTEKMIQTVRVCKDCGAAYSTPGMTKLHKQSKGHDGGFKTIKREIEKKPSIIYYNPGAGTVEQHSEDIESAIVTIVTIDGEDRYRTDFWGESR